VDDLSARYADTVDWLYHVEVSRGWDLKLESVRRALSLLGDPQSEFPTLHVAGTNGKGSTSAIAHAVLERQGLRVGLFTSPHLSDFRERIRVGDEEIGEEAVVDLVAEIRERLSGRDVELTFFELTTVLAFLWFARAGVDAAVVEVGLGGRLDATNVLVPRAAVVTTIGYDHERYLGSTLVRSPERRPASSSPACPRSSVGERAGRGRAFSGRAAAGEPTAALRRGLSRRGDGRDVRLRRPANDSRATLRASRAAFRSITPPSRSPGSRTVVGSTRLPTRSCARACGPFAGRAASR